MKKQTEEERRIGRDSRQALIDDYIANNAYSGDYLEKVMPRYQWKVLKVLTGDRSLRNAINVKCLDCTCFNAVEITNCTIKTCSLYGLRPYQPKDKNDQ